ncbi:hypothetical protein ACVWW6_000190 [Bradyrhizobium sp. USDA 3311]
MVRESNQCSPPSPVSIKFGSAFLSSYSVNAANFPPKGATQRLSLSNISIEFSLLAVKDAMSWLRLSEQQFRVDKWSLCQS